MTKKMSLSFYFLHQPAVFWVDVRCVLQCGVRTNVSQLIGCQCTTLDRLPITDHQPGDWTQNLLAVRWRDTIDRNTIHTFTLEAALCVDCSQICAHAGILCFVVGFDFFFFLVNNKNTDVLLSLAPDRWAYPLSQRKEESQHGKLIKTQIKLHKKKTNQN